MSSLVTITFSPLTPALQVSSSSVLELRGWYSRSYVAPDGITGVEGGNSQTGFYYSWTPTLSGGLLNIPDLEVQATVGSNPTASFFLELFVDGSAVQQIIPNNNVSSGWQIPLSYGSTISFDELATYNRAKRLVYPPNTYFTADQTIAEILRLAGSQAYATTSVAGITRLSVAPEDASVPIAVGDNDPRLGGSLDICNLVEDYDADNTGIEDASGALQQAINDGHSRIYCPRQSDGSPGVYLIDQGRIYENAVVINMYCGHPYLELFGDGQGQTIWKVNDPVAWNDNTILIGMRHPDRINTHQRIHDMTFQGATVALTGNLQVIECRTPNGEVDHCEFLHWNNGPNGSIAGAAIFQTGMQGVDFSGYWAEEVRTTSSSISSGSQEVTPDSMNGIYVGGFLDITDDDFSNYETVLVEDKTDTTFTATFVSSYTGPVLIVGYSENKQFLKLHDNYIHDCLRASAFVLASNENEVCFNRIFNVGMPDTDTGMHAFYEQGGYNNIHHNHIRGIGGIGYKAEKNVANVDTAGSNFESNKVEDCWQGFVYTTQGFEDPALPDDNLIDSISVTARGSGYAGSPAVTVTGGPGSGAELLAVISDGEVVEVVVTKGGSGYDAGSSYTVNFSGGGGSGAAASVTANTAVGFPSNRYSNIVNNIFRRSSARGFDPITNSELIAPVQLGSGTRTNFAGNTLEDLPTSTLAPYWVLSGGAGNKVNNNTILQVNSSLKATAILLGERDQAVDNFIYGRYFSTAIAVPTNTLVKGNQIWLLGDVGDSGYAFDIGPLGDNVTIADNTVHATTTSGLIFGFSGPRNLNMHDNAFILLNGGPLLQVALPASTGILHHNKVVGGYYAALNSTGSGLVLSENSMVMVGATGTAVTYKAGRLGEYTTSAGINIAANKLVKLDSSGKLAAVGTSDTDFIGITTSAINSVGEGTAYIVDQPGAQYEVETDGAWVQGNVGVVSTGTASTIHDSGTPTPPSYFSSYVIFLDSGSSGLATVRLVNPSSGSNAVTTFADLDASPSVLTGTMFNCANSMATNVTNFDDGVDGKTITIRFTTGNTTIKQGASINNQSGGDVTVTVNTIKSYSRFSGVWYEA